MDLFAWTIPLYNRSCVQGNGGSDIDETLHIVRELFMVHINWIEGFNNLDAVAGFKKFLTM